MVDPELLASLQPALVHRWVAGPAWPRWRSIDGTVVSADISGFTRLAEELADEGVRLAAERLNATINRCFAPMIEAVADRGGQVLKFGGDALFIVFEHIGPEGDADHARQGCAAAMAMQEVLAATDVGIDGPLSMTVGVATGSIEVILAGTDRRELVVHGATVDECLRLEGEAEPGEVLISASTARLVPTDWIDDDDPEVCRLVGPDSTTAPAPPPRQPQPPSRHPPPMQAAGMHPPAPEPDPGRAAAVDLPRLIGPELTGAVGAFAGTGGELRVVTVSFVELPTADLAAELVDETVGRAERLARRHGVNLLGSDVSRRGVKLLLVAGAPTAGDADEDAMLGLLADLIAGGDGPPMRAGVNRGLVYAGFLGSPRFRTFTVMGDPTNLAARLLGKAELGTIAVTQPVLDEARASYPTTELSPILVRGRLAPVTVHRLDGPAGERRTAEIEPSFVGRASESAVVRSAIEGLQRGRGSALRIVGESGFGSSRLIVRSLAGLPAGVLRMTLTRPLAGPTPYAAVTSTLRSLAGLDRPADSASTADADAQAQTDAETHALMQSDADVGPGSGGDGEAEIETENGDPIDPVDEVEVLRAWLARVAPETLTLLPLVAVAFGIQTPANETTESIKDEFRGDRINEAILAALTGALTVPTVLVAEDTHHLDRASQLLCQVIAEHCGDRPWLLITSSRPEADETIGGQMITLDPLPLDAAEELIGGLADLPAERQRQLAELSGGNPRFAVELIRATIGTDGDGPGSRADVDGLDLRSIETLVTARIDRLGHENRALLRAAAVLGRRFSLSALLAVLAADGAEPDLLDGLTTLPDRLARLVDPAGDGWFTFRSGIIHQVAYGGLSAKRRQELHHIVADALEGEGGDVADLAWHHQQAGNDASGWAYSRQAAERAHGLGLVEEAARHLERAVAAADRVGSTVVSEDQLTASLVELFHADVAAKRYDEAMAVGERALDRLHDTTAWARLIYRYVAAKAEIDGSYDQQANWLDGQLSRLGDDPGQAEARAWVEATLAGLRWRNDQPDQALTAAAAAVDAARQAGTVDLVPPVQLIRHGILADRADPGRHAVAAELIEAATAADDVTALIAGHNNIGLDLQAGGRWEEAREHYERSIELAERIGDGARAMYPRINQAILLVDQGRWDDARPLLDELRRAASYHGGGFLIAWVKRELARMEIHAGHAETARPWLREAADWYREAEIGSSLYEVALLSMAADLADGRSGAVLEAADQLVVPRDVVPRLIGQPATLRGYALLQQGEASRAFEWFADAVEETGETYLFGHVLAMVGRAESERDLGHGRASRRTMAEADTIMERLGIVAIPVVPLPR